MSLVPNHKHHLRLVTLDPTGAAVQRRIFAFEVEDASITPVPQEGDPLDTSAPFCIVDKNDGRCIDGNGRSYPTIDAFVSAHRDQGPEVSL